MTHLKTSPHVRIMQLLIALGVTLGGVTSAFARPDVDVTFQHVQVSQQRDDVVLEYAIDAQSWREVARAGIEARLNIYTPEGRSGRFIYRYSVPLKDRQGRVIYNRRDVTLDGAQHVRVELVGYNGPLKIGRITYGRQCDTQVLVDVTGRGQTAQPPRQPNHPPQHQGPPPRPNGPRGDGGAGHHSDAWAADVVRACGRASQFDSEVNACIERAMRLSPEDAALTVDACSSATSFSSGRNACLDSALAVPRGQRQTVVTACGQATQHDSELQSCIAQGARLNDFRAGEVIAACGRHTSFASELNQCLGAAVGVRGDRVAMVNACGESTQFASQLSQCLERASGAASAPPPSDRGGRRGRR